MQEALQRFVAAMASYKETHTLSEEEGALLQNACVSLTDTLCPFIVERLSKIFPTPANLIDLSAMTAALRDLGDSHDQDKHIPASVEQGTPVSVS